MIEHNGKTYAPDASGWYDIACAPKDGTEIFTFSPLAKQSGNKQLQINKWHNNVWWCSNQKFWPSTHWQPLPKPPEGV